MSPKSNAFRASLKLTSNDLRQLESVMDDIEEHIGKVAGIWVLASREHQREVLERSPILSRFLNLAESVLC